MAKALNSKNLSALGPERLADLLIEVTKGRADLQRRLRSELNAAQGPEDVARDLRKRYAALRQPNRLVVGRCGHLKRADCKGGITIAVQASLAVNHLARFDAAY